MTERRLFMKEFQSITKTKGGKREGAGRKLAPYKTTTIAFRVRVEWVKELKQLINERIDMLRNGCS